MTNMTPNRRTRIASALMLTLLAAAGLLFKSSCGSYAGNPEEDDEDNQNLQMVQLPDARSIDLSTLGRKTGIPLTMETTNPCDGELNLGVFGMPIGAACHTSFMANSIIYGAKPDRDADGKLTCADYKNGESDNGILPPLLCEKGILRTPKIKSLRFAEKGENIAFSFEDFSQTDDVNALGHWTARGEDSGRYPANIRVWSGRPEFKRVMALSLKDAMSGNLSVDFNFDGYPGIMTSGFGQPASAAGCASAPSRDNCYTQEIRMNTFGDPNTFSPGVILYIYADARENPSFVAIEGKFSYSREIAEKIFSVEKGNPESFKKIREIYVRTVQKGTQIWGSFDFKDEAGKTIQTPVITDSGVTDVTKVLRDGAGNVPYSGVCQDRGVDAWVACKDIVYTDYDAVWLGDAAITPVLKDFDFDIDFTNPPAENGVVQVP